MPRGSDAVLSPEGDGVGGFVSEDVRCTMPFTRSIIFVLSTTSWIRLAAQQRRSRQEDVQMPVMDYTIVVP